MQQIPRRQSLVSQTATLLREEIGRGSWQEWLPGERALCESLQVSRNTLRSALGQLQSEGLIQSEHGAGNRILKTSGRKSRRRQTFDVGLLSPEPMERLRPTQTLWIDELRAMFSERNCRLHVFHGRQYFRTNPGPALKRLIAENPHGCWILTLSNEAIQKWFADHEVNCVVAGSVHAGLDLPYRDLDHRAICRHAAGVLLGLGHRQLALIIAKSELAGDLQSQQGFLEGVKQSNQAGATATILQHEGTVGSIGNLLRRVLDQSQPPTGILVANAYHYLTVVSRLAQAGCRVPQDISVISRDDDLFLSYVLPAPARYCADPQALAKSLLRPVLALLNADQSVKRAIRLMPDFMRGDSVREVRV